jgi:hypothetical protein
MNHTYYTSEDCTCEDNNGCWICTNITEGGLTCCKVCKGIEGSLTTECCGRPLSSAEQDQIYNKGDLDFRNGLWVREPNPTNQMWNERKQNEHKTRNN